MKLLVRFLLIFSLLLIGRDSCLRSYADQKTNLIIRQTQPDAGKDGKVKVVTIEEEEEDDKEDEEVVYSKICHHSGYQLLPFSYSLFPQYFSDSYKIPSLYSKYSFHSFPDKTILHKVFRI